jgi:hypothetical protein
MIALEVNGSYLDLLPGQAVTLTSNSPLFDRDRIDRVFSLPFSLPATPRNIIAIGPFNRIDSDIVEAVPAKLYLLGTLYEQGFLRLVSPGIAQAEFVFQGGALFLRERLERLRLRNLNLPIEITTPYAPAIVVGADIPGPPFVKMTLGINDLVFTTDAGDLATMLALINAEFPGIASDAGSSPASPRILINPVPALPSNFIIREFPVVDDPETHVFFRVAQSTYEDESERLGNAWASYLETPNAFAAFPVTFAPNLYGEKNQAWLGYANYVTPDGDHPNDPRAYFSGGWAHTLLPYPRITAVLPGIAAAVGLTAFEGNFFEEETESLCLWSNRPLDAIFSLYEYQEGEAETLPVHTYPASYNLQDHLPDISALELIVRLCNTFCLFVYPSRSFLRLEPVAPKLRAQPRDWTQYADPTFRAQYDSREGFSLDYDRQGDETALPNQLERVDGGPDAAEFRPGFYTLFDTRQVDSIAETRAWITPYIIQQGNSPYFGLSQEPSLRLIFDRGMQEDNDENEYPHASHANLNTLRQPVGEYSLDWQGDAGLFQKWWAPFIRITQRNQRITLPMRLPLAELLALREWSHSVRSIYTEHGHFVGAIESVRFTVTAQGLNVAEVTFLKM